MNSLLKLVMGTKLPKYYSLVHCLKGFDFSKERANAIGEGRKYKLAFPFWEDKCQATTINTHGDN
jgi:hypothetical protein